MCNTDTQREPPTRSSRDALHTTIVIAPAKRQLQQKSALPGWLLRAHADVIPDHRECSEVALSSIQVPDKPEIYSRGEGVICSERYSYEERPAKIHGEQFRKL
jgi:hypothetical protein